MSHPSDNKFRLIVFFLAMFAVLPEAQSFPYGFVGQSTYGVNPSIIVRDDKTGAIKTYNARQAPITIVCYGWDLNQLLPCPYTYQLIGVDPGTDPLVTFNPPLTTLESYGGHEHGFDTHPFYWVADPSDPPIFPHDPIQVLIGGPFTRPDSLTVQGNTQGQVNYLYFYAPEAAGSTWVDLTVDSPPGWETDPPSWTPTESRYHLTYVTEIGGFEALPLQSADYVVVRNPDTGHPDANAMWGLPNTISALEIVAQKYHTVTSRRLSVNDMSLPHGGLFDIGYDWAPPHKTHRDGTAFDVNRCGEDGICVDCDHQRELFDVVGDIDDIPPSSVHANSTPVGILCEPAGGKPKVKIHINVYSP